MAMFYGGPFDGEDLGVEDQLGAERNFPPWEAMIRVLKGQQLNMQEHAHLMQPPNPDYAVYRRENRDGKDGYFYIKSIPWDVAITLDNSAHLIYRAD